MLIPLQDIHIGKFTLTPGVRQYSGKSQMKDEENQRDSLTLDGKLSRNLWRETIEERMVSSKLDSIDMSSAYYNIIMDVDIISLWESLDL